MRKRDEGRGKNRTGQEREIFRVTDI